MLPNQLNFVLFSPYNIIRACEHSRVQRMGDLCILQSVSERKKTKKHKQRPSDKHTDKTMENKEIKDELRKIISKKERKEVRKKERKNKPTKKDRQTKRDKG